MLPEKTQELKINQLKSHTYF